MSQGDHLSEVDRAIGALQDGTRRRILFDFYAHEAEVTAEEVASAVGIHRTVAYAHLERLVALGFLISGRRRGRYGKPAKVYRLAGQQIDLSYPIRRFARLAALLAQSLHNLGQDGVQAAREAGRTYGASLVSRRTSSAETVVSQLAPLGAEYVLEGDRVLARNCIFREACAAAEDIVCEFQAGLLEGSFREAGVALRPEALRDYESHGCAYRLVAV
jgi:predicted ArsR family transcriptional regulator